MYQDLSQFTLPPGWRGRPGYIVLLWMLVQGALFRWSPQPCYGFRRWLARLFGAKLGRGVLLRPSVQMTYPWKITIGDYSWIGDNVVLYSLGEIEIGAHTVVSQNCYICTGNHDTRDPNFAIFAKPVRIADEAWLASDVFVAPGVTIGRGTVVGARATIFSDLPGGVICRGAFAERRTERKTNCNPPTDTTPTG